MSETDQPLPNPEPKPVADKAKLPLKQSVGWQGDFKPLGAMRDSFYELMEQDYHGYR